MILFKNNKKILEKDQMTHKIIIILLIIIIENLVLMIKVLHYNLTLEILHYKILMQSREKIQICFWIDSIVK